jgi:hypothetical protein
VKTSIAFIAAICAACSSGAATPSKDGGPPAPDGGSPANDASQAVDAAPTPDADVPVTTYTPMVHLDFEDGKPPGTDAGWLSTTGGPMSYDDAHARSGKSSIQVLMRDQKNGYGGYLNMPTAVKPGSTVWYRVYLYMPSTLSLSYGDVSGDGFGWNKFLVMAEYQHDGSRMYIQPRSSYEVDYGQPNFIGTGLYVNHDGLGDSYCQLEQDSYAFPRDRWFALQMAWKVETDATASVRVWSDATFVGECVGAGVVPSDYAVQSFGIGDYWNGGAWIKNASTGSFWIDDIVVTVDPPNTLDDGGRPFIDPRNF